MNPKHLLSESLTSPLAGNAVAHVLSNPDISLADKRAKLASWASDAKAVPGCPTLRQIEGGTLVPVETILEALKTMEADFTAAPSAKLRGASQGTARRRISSPPPGWRWWSRRFRRDDDDNPPPSPALIAPRPSGHGGPAAAVPEPAVCA